jgi:hypothetical protein
MTKAEYGKLIRDCRKKQLLRTREEVAQLEAIYQAAADSLSAKITALGGEDKPVQQAHLANLLEGLQDVLQSLRRDTAVLMETGMLSLAQTAADTQARVAGFAGAPADGRVLATLSTTRTLSDGKQVSVSFGRVAKRAVEEVAKRVYSDGYKLSDRLYRLDAAAKKAVGDTITQGVAEQISARAMSRRIQDTMTKAGTDCPRYRAATIAQTEINNAHREAQIASLYDADGKAKSYVAGVGWRLSPSHPKVCQCDLLASDDPDDLGAGNYLVDNAPTAPHPRCLCFLVTLLVDYPELQFPGKAPMPDDVPARLRNDP